jgi:hypothetical protein
MRLPQRMITAGAHPFRNLIAERVGEHESRCSQLVAGSRERSYIGCKSWSCS